MLSFSNILKETFLSHFSVDTPFTKPLLKQSQNTLALESTAQGKFT